MLVLQKRYSFHRYKFGDKMGGKRCIFYCTEVLLILKYLYPVSEEIEKSKNRRSLEKMQVIAVPESGFFHASTN